MNTSVLFTAGRSVAGFPLRIALFAAALGYQIGATGPILGHVARDFGVGLGLAGLVGTATLLAHAASQMPAASPIRRHGPLAVARIGLVWVFLAGVAGAAAPTLTVLLASRFALGLGTGVLFVVGIEWARLEGGPLVAGVFGGSAVMGIGLSVLAGGISESIGLSWSVPLAVSAAIAAGAIGLVRGEVASTTPQVAGTAVVMRNGALWRVALLHTATFGTSLVVAAWIVAYLTEHGTGVGLAGAAGLLLLGAGAIARPFGGTLLARGIAWRVPSLGGLALTALGLTGIALYADTAVLPAFLLIAGVGLSLPFAAAFAASNALEPTRSAAAAAFVNLTGSVFALAAVPLAGADIDHSGGEVTFVVLAALALVAIAVNRRSPMPG